MLTENRRLQHFCKNFPKSKNLLLLTNSSAKLFRHMKRNDSSCRNITSLGTGWVNCCPYSITYSSYGCPKRNATIPLCSQDMTYHLFYRGTTTVSPCRNGPDKVSLHSITTNDWHTELEIPTGLFQLQQHSSCMFCFFLLLLTSFQLQNAPYF